MCGVALIRGAYSGVGMAITPLLKLWLERRARRGKEDPFRMGERFGYATRPRPEAPVVWLHAASVGETQSVLTLVRALLAEHPHIHLLITTQFQTAIVVSDTGQARAETCGNLNDMHVTVHFDDIFV